VYDCLLIEEVAISVVESISVANSNPPAIISSYRTGPALALSVAGRVGRIQLCWTTANNLL